MSASSGNLQSRLQSLKSERGDQIKIDEVAEVVSSIMSTMQGDVSAVDLRVYKELDDLADYINNAKSEIALVRTDDISEEHLPAAADELDAIVTHTEEATGTILDAAEVIDAEASKLGCQAISDQVMLIFEACSFQDITGQRISKIVATLKHIEDRIEKINAVFGIELKRKHRAAKVIAAPNTQEEADAALLHGPQIPIKANDQDEIDALLASFD
jgi:chemotaxis protein CheZ